MGKDNDPISPIIAEADAVVAYIHALVALMKKQGVSRQEAIMRVSLAIEKIWQPPEIPEKIRQQLIDKQIDIDQYIEERRTKLSPFK